MTATRLDGGFQQHYILEFQNLCYSEAFSIKTANLADGEFEDGSGDSAFAPAFGRAWQDAAAEADLRTA
jgi:hypothetical protein